MDLRVARWEIMVSWPVEHIPDPDTLYMAVLRLHWDDGNIASAALRDSPNKGEGMSTNWSKYSAARDVRENRRHLPGEYGVVSFVVGKVRSVSTDTEVRHSPEKPNRAHSLILGPKDSETRVHYRRYLNKLIEPDL